MRKNKFQLECEIIKIEKIIDGIFHFTIKAPEIANIAKAGQFLEIQVSKTGEVFLRRPFSIYNINKEKGEVEFIFQVKGKGTKILSTRKVGETLNILGPLGNGTFSVKKYNRIALIGGGIGTYPLYELAKELKENGSSNVYMYMGFRNKSLVTLEKEFGEVTDRVIITTDDGSYKEKGFALDMLKNDCLKEKPDIIFACGPLPMLKAVQNFANENLIKCEMSLEERMGCGIYACVGCNVRIVTNNPDEIKYKYVCTNGPVFDSKEVII
ncbi:MAG: dihydroorotate dehydrogenase electron transfer subunit [Clostridia bacterium]|nr:dihydroorotate dehydrogenase electron transfer subunit [Clostridia bacterium]